MIVLIVLGAILLALVVAFIAFYRHSRTPEWGTPTSASRCSG